MIRKMELDEEDQMVSFDVVSLFTGINVNDALETLSPPYYTVMIA